MRISIRWRMIIVAVVIALALVQLYYTFAYYTLSDEKKITMKPEEINRMKDRALKLGLDLRGGMDIIMEVDKSKLTEEEAKGAVDRAIQVIRNRIDQFGVSEPKVEKLGSDRIAVKLPGVVDSERAKSLIGKTAQLEFRIVAENEVFNNLVGEIDKKLEQMETDQYMRLAGMIDFNGFDYLVYSENWDIAKEIFAMDEIKPLIPAGYTILWGKERENEGIMQKAIYLIEKNAVLKGDAILDARAGQGTNDNPLGIKVDLIMTRNAKNKWASITGSNIGKRIAMVLDDVVVSAPRVNERIPSGSSMITMGNSTIEDAKDLAIILKAGALPAPVKIVEERTIGPSLGSDSIQKGVRAIIWGLILVLVFMAIYYSLSGLIADFALMLNLIILLSVLSLFRATLTLPGMAGIVLIIGTAVDANVLIFERIREEMRSGKTIRTAISAGYDKAFKTILDANVTSFLAAIILYWFGTGAIKGFAVTLGVGLVVSFFTAIVVTRLIFDLFTGNKNIKRIRI